ncbi:transposase [Neisseria sp. ZJ106]|uniref:Transposase n=1 Tax=Neisseria lisongii TaxID=2912188 RepID=A0ABY7RM69_9NEIS|nr:transposase [Neisseria lisongii]MCF7521965.1 transposase [Neisseria lisongii]WCL71339.1 transposase [Neisseria lisongii]WCL72333.1 transposase [Neisseria lisongii]
MYYLGIDISKHTIDCCLISDGCYYEKQFSNTEKGFQNLEQWLVGHHATENLHCCCEATGIYYEKLAEYLYCRYIISVENPRKIKGYAQSKLQRTKNDKQDAKLIAEYCRTNKPKHWQPPTPEQKQLQELTRYLTYLKQRRAAEQTKCHQSPDYIIKHIQETLIHLNHQIRTVNQQLQEFYKTHPEYDTQRRQLQSITGIGEQSSATLLSAYKRHQFTNSKQFTAYFGLDPKQHQSGSSIKGKSRISKIGSAALRKNLYMPALVAYRCNAFPQLTARLRAKGKPPKLIITAIMRKLAVIAFTLLKNGETFDKTRYQ